MLNVQLNEMERHGLIAKTVYPELTPRVEYYLTEFGRTLLPLVDAMTQWGETHRARLEQAGLA